MEGINFFSSFILWCCFFQNKNVFMCADHEYVDLFILFIIIFVYVCLRVRICARTYKLLLMPKVLLKDSSVGGMHFIYGCVGECD